MATHGNGRSVIESANRSMQPPGYQPESNSPEQLTRVPGKWELYRRETYFRQGLTELHSLAKERKRPLADTLHESAMLMIKPDGYAHGVTSKIIHFLHEIGFEVVACSRTDLSGATWRELWRYQLTSATIDRLYLNDMLFSQPGIVLGLRRKYRKEEPATVELTSRKGSADILKQEPDSLRAQLGQPNRMMSLFHVADEPADIIREPQILLGIEHVRQWLADLTDGAPIREHYLGEFVQSTYGADVKTAGLPTMSEANRVTKLALFGLKPSPIKDELLHIFKSATGGEGLDWRRWLTLLGKANIEIDRWVLLVFGTTCVSPDETGESKMIVNPKPGAWDKSRHLN